MAKRTSKVVKRPEKVRAVCPACGEVFWLEVERTVTSVEQVYATRIDCCS